MLIEKIAMMTAKSLTTCLMLDGKNRAFLKSLRITDMMYVPMNRMIDIRKTSEMYSGLAQS